MDKKAKKEALQYGSAMLRFIAMLLLGFAIVLAMASYMQSKVLILLDILVTGANLYMIRNYFITMKNIFSDIRHGRIAEKQITIKECCLDYAYREMTNNYHTPAFNTARNRGQSEQTGSFLTGGNRYLLKDTKEGVYLLSSPLGEDMDNRHVTITYLEKSGLLLQWK